MREGQQALRLGDIVERFGGQLLGDPELLITQVATLESAGSGHISFFANPRYRRQLEQTRADAVIVSPEVADATQRARIVCKDPYAYFARLSTLLNPLPAVAAGIHPSASVDPSARIADTAAIGAFVSIGARAEVGAATLIEAGCVLGEDVHIGSNCRLHANVVVYHDCESAIA